VLVSGGGWAVGDLAGAAEAAIADGATAVCLCGRNEEVRQALARRFAGDERVVVLGFSDRMAELMAAADVLVHSTAGLTVLEALMEGCRVISYGWGHGHVRVNNEAYRRFSLARVATDRAELRAPSSARSPYPSPGARAGRAPARPRASTSSRAAAAWPAAVGGGGARAWRGWVGRRLVATRADVADSPRGVTEPRRDRPAVATGPPRGDLPPCRWLTHLSPDSRQPRRKPRGTSQGARLTRFAEATAGVATT
jgi:hypothetical protein